MTALSDRIYLVDDDQLLRKTVISILEPEGFEVIEFESGVDFLDAVKDLEPGIVLLDLKMPNVGGQGVLEAMPGGAFKVIMISGHADIASAVQSLQSGALDFVEKPFTPDGLLAKLRHWQRHSAMPRSTSNENELKVLSKREMEILQLLVAGDPNKVVGFKLGISKRTVEVHRARIMDRLGVDSFAELVRKSVQAGL